VSSRTRDERLNVSEMPTRLNNGGIFGGLALSEMIARRNRRYGRVSTGVAGAVMVALAAIATQASATPQQSPTSSTAATVSGAAASSGFSGDGIFVVPDSVQPGVYVSRNPQSTAGPLHGSRCTWLTRRGGGEVDADGHVLVELEIGDVFTTKGCSRWISFSPPRHPLHRIGDGTWVVPSEVMPGRWRAENTTGQLCVWGRLKDVGDPSSPDGALANGGNVRNEPVVVRIHRGDAYFTTDGCGTWTRVG
jgi:hypothetical protein